VNTPDAIKGASMKSPTRSSKTVAPVTATKKSPVAKLAVANTPYNASDKKAINKNNAPKNASERLAATKKKQAAAQES
jgi:hypothetical protein